MDKTLTVGLRGPGRPPTGGPGSRGGKTKQKAVRFDDETTEWLEKHAADNKTDVSSIVRKAVEWYRMEETV